MRFIAATFVLFLACDPATHQATAGTPAAPRSSATATPDDQVVGTWDGGQITYGDLREQVGNQLIQAEAEYLNSRYQLESQALDELLAGKLLEAEAAAKGFEDVNALLAAEISAKVPDPTEAEVQNLYQMIQHQVGGASLEEMRADIVAELRRRQESTLFATYLGDLKTRTQATTSLPFPDLPRMVVSVDDDPIRGAADAPVTIIEFADFQCPYCGQADPTIERVMEAYPDTVRVVFRDFPLSGHDRAIPAAVAANCAAQQDNDKYWQMHTMLMTHQRSLDEESLVAHAKSLDLNMKKWEKCRADPDQVAEVQRDQDDGVKAGVNGTPAFFINGILISGAQPFEQFKTIIDRELARAE